MVALFEPLWVSYWQGGGMSVYDSTATVSGTSYTSCSAGLVSGCTWGPLTAYSQTMSLMSKSGLWLPTPAHTPRSSPLLHSPTHPTPTHGMWLYVLTRHCVPLLVTVAHLFDPLISLHDQSIRHGTHGGGLASRATMTTNTFGSGSWTSVGRYQGCVGWQYTTHTT